MSRFEELDWRPTPLGEISLRRRLSDPRVRSLHVIEALGEVIGWHRRGLLPLSDLLTSDRRCGRVEGD